MKFGRRGFLKGLGSLVAVIPLGLKLRTVPEVQKEPLLPEPLHNAIEQNLYPVHGCYSSGNLPIPPGGWFEPSLEIDYRSWEVGISTQKHIDSLSLGIGMAPGENEPTVEYFCDADCGRCNDDLCDCLHCKERITCDHDHCF